MRNGKIYYNGRVQIQMSQKNSTRLDQLLQQRQRGATDGAGRLVLRKPEVIPQAHGQSATRYRQQPGENWLTWVWKLWEGVKRPREIACIGGITRNPLPD